MRSKIKIVFYIFNIKLLILYTLDKYFPGSPGLNGRSPICMTQARS
jgi:hypothetical protein